MQQDEKKKLIFFFFDQTWTMMLPRVSYFSMVSPQWSGRAASSKFSLYYLVYLSKDSPYTPPIQAAPHYASC